MKTAREQAIDIIKEYINVFDNKTLVGFSFIVDCALLKVDGIIKETKLHDLTTFEHGRTAYWIEVKEEIKSFLNT